jgi:hypothetical protein
MDNIFALSDVVKDESSNKLNNLKEVGYEFDFFGKFIHFNKIYFFWQKQKRFGKKAQTLLSKSYIQMP